MDNRLADLESRAEAFLHGRLRPSREVSSDLVREITKLATEDGDNPLKELFRATDRTRSAASPPPLPLSTTSSHSTQSAEPLRQRSSKFSLNFRRNKDKDRSGSSNGPRPQTAGSATKAPQFSSRVHESEMWVDHATNLAVLGFNVAEEEKRNLSAAATPSSSKQGKTKSGSQVTYNCVFCRDDYSSKGTCKRHLEDMHVARKFLQCRSCQHKFKTVPEARKHTESCGVGVLGWCEAKPAPRQVYSSEFVSKVFRTQQQYIDHLLDLCAESPGSRPHLSPHRKLRNLLEQPDMQGTVSALSFRLFGDTRIWKDIRWESETLRSAIHDLENGIPEPDMRTFGNGMQNKMEMFLERLFASTRPPHGATPTTGSDMNVVTHGEKIPTSEVRVKEETPRDDMQHSLSTLHPDRMPSQPGHGGHVTEAYYRSPHDVHTPTNGDTISKRPLSYESAARIPERLPPGPPTGFPQVFNNTNDNNSPMTNTFALDTAMSTNPSFNNTPLSNPVTTWPATEQPPPYDGMLQNSNGLAQHTFQGPVNTTMPTTMEYYTSPMQIIPPAQFGPTSAGDHMLEMYPQQYTGVFDGNVNQYHMSEATHNANTTSWLSISDGRNLHPPQQPPHDGQHNGQSGGHDTGAGASYPTYQGGVLDRMCRR